MLIVAKGAACILNTEYITKIYVGSDGCAIKADFQNGQGTQIGRYDTNKAAITAMTMVAEELKRLSEKGSAVFFPDDEAVKQQIIHEDVKIHPVNGQKRKSHGGS